MHQSRNPSAAREVGQARRFDFGIGRKNVLLIGSGAHAAYVAQEIKKAPALGMRVVGLLGSGPRGGDKVGYLGDLSRLDEVITEHLVDEVIVVDADLSPAEMTRIIGICSDRSLAIDFVPAALCQVSPRINAIGTFVFVTSMTLVVLAQLLLTGRGAGRSAAAPTPRPSPPAAAARCRPARRGPCH